MDRSNIYGLRSTNKPFVQRAPGLLITAEWAGAREAELSTSKTPP